MTKVCEPLEMIYFERALCELNAARIEGGFTPVERWLELAEEDQRWLLTRARELKQEEAVQ
jgi:hypothetical protein